MADYTKPTGAGGTLLIRDTGSAVEFWLGQSISATFSGGIPWSGNVNGVGVGGSFPWSSGGGWRLVASYGVSTSQNVTFAIGSTGTSGFGGPTSLTAYINRTPPATVPSVPGNPTFSEITPTSVRVSWAASASNGGAAIDGYLLRRRSVVNGPYVDVSQANDRSRVVSGLTPGATYVFSVYAHNSVGYSTQTAQLSVTLPARAYVGKGGSYPAASAVNVGKAGAFPAAAEIRVGKGGTYVTPS